MFFFFGSRYLLGSNIELSFVDITECKPILKIFKK